MRLPRAQRFATASTRILRMPLAREAIQLKLSTDLACSTIAGGHPVFNRVTQSAGAVAVPNEVAHLGVEVKARTDLFCQPGTQHLATALAHWNHGFTVKWPTKLPATGLTRRDRRRRGSV